LCDSSVDRDVTLNKAAAQKVWCKHAVPQKNPTLQSGYGQAPQELKWNGRMHDCPRYAATSSLKKTSGPQVIVL